MMHTLRRNGRRNFGNLDLLSEDGAIQNLDDPILPVDLQVPVFTQVIILG